MVNSNMRLLAVIVFLYTLLPVHAENFYTGDKLLDHCEDCIYSANISSVSACAYCISHMSSIHDAFVDWGFMEPKWCIAGDIMFSELTKTIMAYIYENPSSRHQYSTNSIANSLIENYPCNQ